LEISVEIDDKTILVLNAKDLDFQLNSNFILKQIYEYLQLRVPFDRAFATIFLDTAIQI